MSTVDWRKSEEFGLLCDLVASDHLVCLTGAGISRPMRRASGGGTLPGWIDMLRALLSRFESVMDAAALRSAKRLLNPVDERPSASALRATLDGELAGARLASAVEALNDLGPRIGSRELILAASLIREANPSAFDDEFGRMITEEPGQTTDTHVALLETMARGVVTFNYDRGHETACTNAGQAFVSISPTDEDADAHLHGLLSARIEEFFILKAHGSIESPGPLVLTTDGYRELIAKNPSFRAFVQNLFTNFSFLMVGYGLDDPDFDLFLGTMAEQFASPLQHHVVLRPIWESHRGEEIERLRYGIRTLHVNGFSEIPIAIRAAAVTPGPKLRETIELCRSTKQPDRRSGHERLKRLGPSGRQLAGVTFIGLLDGTDSFDASEAAYCLGLLDAAKYKSDLIALVDRRNESDVLGRTITVLRPAMTTSDLPTIQDWIERFTDTPPDGDRPDRILVYLRYLQTYVSHKYQSDPAL